MDISPLLALQLGVVIFLAAVLRGITGFGFAIAAVPPLSFLVAPSMAVVIVALLQVMVGVRDIPTLRHDMDKQALKWLALGALLGTPLGVLLLSSLDPALVKISVAAIVLVAVPVLLSPKRFAFPPGPKSALPSGMASGFFGGLAAMPGPPAILYFVGSQSKTVQTRASLMVFFVITASCSVPMFWLSDLISLEIIGISLAALPLFFAGGWVGAKIFARTSDAAYRYASIAILVAMAGATAVQGFLEL